MKKHILSLLLNEQRSIVPKSPNIINNYRNNDKYSVLEIYNNSEIDGIAKLGPTFLTEQVETSDPDEFFTEFYNYEYDECFP